MLLSELGWKGSSNDSGSFHVFLVDILRPLDTVGDTQSLEQCPVKFGGKELQYVLIVRVPGSKASDDECVHCDRAGPSSLQHRFQILVLLLLPLPWLP